MLPSKTRLFVLSVVLGLSICLLSPAPASAGSPSYTLWTDGVDGWSSTNTSFTNPGPHLTVYVGDNVTLVLNATDGASHRWFIDYNDDSARSGNEPQSPQFRDVAVTWNFTADQNGTYNYRDRSNPTLAGQITILEGAPPSGGLDSSVVVAIGAVIAVVGVVLILFLLMRKPTQKPEKK